MMSRGKGSVRIYSIKNQSPYNLEELHSIARIEVYSIGLFEAYTILFSIPQSEESIKDQVCEGLGERIMGIVIDYSEGLEVKSMSLNLIQ